jgi:hypothetical protein
VPSVAAAAFMEDCRCPAASLGVRGPDVVTTQTPVAVVASQASASAAAPLTSRPVVSRPLVPAEFVLKSRPRSRAENSGVSLRRCGSVASAAAGGQRFLKQRWASHLILMVGTNGRPVVTTGVTNVQPVIVIVCLWISTAGASTTSPLPTWQYSASNVRGVSISVPWATVLTLVLGSITCLSGGWFGGQLLRP